MATSFTPQEINLSEINGGNRFEPGDGVTPDAINRPIEAAAYAQQQANKVVSLGETPPDYSKAGGSGTPKVSIETLSNGKQRFVFENIIGPLGPTGPRGFSFYAATAADYTTVRALMNTGDLLLTTENISSIVNIRTMMAGSAPGDIYELASGDQYYFRGSILGMQGEPGPQGPVGPQGVSIVNVIKSSSSGRVDTYTISFSNGNTSAFTVTNGEDGSTPQFKAENNQLWVSYDGGVTWKYLQNIQQGVDGEDGIGITKAEINADGELVLTYSNNSIANLGRVVGESGKEATLVASSTPHIGVYSFSALSFDLKYEGESLKGTSPILLDLERLYLAELGVIDEAADATIYLKDVVFKRIRNHTDADTNFLMFEMSSLDGDRQRAYRVSLRVNIGSSQILYNMHATRDTTFLTNGPVYLSVVQEGCKAYSRYSMAVGRDTIARSENSFACGQWNEDNENRLFQVGIGESNEKRKDAVYVDKETGALHVTALCKDDRPWIENVVVNVEELITKQDTATFIALTQRYMRGEITITVVVNHAYGIVTGAYYRGDREMGWTVSAPSFLINHNPGFGTLTAASMVIYVLDYRDGTLSFAYKDFPLSGSGGTIYQHILSLRGKGNASNYAYATIFSDKEEAYTLETLQEFLISVDAVNDSDYVYNPLFVGKGIYGATGIFTLSNDRYAVLGIGYYKAEGVLMYGFSVADASHANRDQVLSVNDTVRVLPLGGAGA